MKTSLFGFVIGLLLAVPALAASQTTELRAGAAKVDITPPTNSLPSGYLGILDPLYARALVLDDGSSRAALITIDAGAVSEEVWQRVSAEADRELKIPRTNVLITATHTHSAPRDSAERVTKGILEAIRSAIATLQPAQVRLGSGQSHINVNRNIIHPETRRWWEGVNHDGPSDKTVTVMYVYSREGAPIAVYYNYAVHAVLLGQTDLVSGDLPGAASRYIEESLVGAVAIWSEGAAGDQNPVYFQQTYDLREIRVRDYAKRGIDISNAMPPGGQGLDRSDPKVKRLMDQQKQMALSMGQMLGEEVLYVIRERLERPILHSKLFGAQKTVTCPGRKRTDSGRAGYPGTYVDADPIPIRLSLVTIGDVAIAGVNAEVFNMIAQRLKRESPLKHTMMATLTNGVAPSGYIPHDAAFGFHTFEVLSSRLKPGCAESAIVNGALDLIEQSRIALMNAAR
jgi:neutral ceramidase